MEKLVASLELDERIAQTVMGIVPCDAWHQSEFGWAHGVAVWAKDKDGCDHGKCYPPKSPPRYSIDMGRAGQLLGKLFKWAAEHDAAITLAYAPAFTGYRCTVYVPLAEDCLEEDDEEYHWPKADDFYDTPELAICEAALEYLQGET